MGIHKQIVALGHRKNGFEMLSRFSAKAVGEPGQLESRQSTFDFAQALLKDSGNIH